MEQQNALSQEQQIVELLGIIQQQKEIINSLRQDLKDLCAGVRKFLFCEEFSFGTKSTQETKKTFNALMKNAKKSIELFDSYVDPYALSLLEGKSKDVPLRIYTSSLSKITQKDIDNYIEKNGLFKASHLLGVTPFVTLTNLLGYTSYHSLNVSFLRMSV